MTITLVRHGQTENNYLEIIQGSSDNSLLNDTGRRQCLRLKEKIKDKHFDYCYMSPMVRAVETAMILIGDRVLTIPDDRLIERGLGELEGRPRSEYNAYKFWDYDLNFNKFGVEPIQDVFKRCSDFLEYIKNKYPDKDILIVTHGAIYKALRYLIIGQELKGNLLGKYVDNCQMESFTIKS